VVPGELLAEPVDRSSVRLEETGEAKEERGFSRPWPSDQSHNLTGSDIDTDIAQRGYRDGSRSRAGMVRLVEAPHGQCELHGRSSANMCEHDRYAWPAVSNRWLARESIASRDGAIFSP
jgi:hypothetical protein